MLAPWTKPTGFRSVSGFKIAVAGGMSDDECDASLVRNSCERLDARHWIVRRFCSQNARPVRVGVIFARLISWSCAAFDADDVSVVVM